MANPLELHRLSPAKLVPAMQAAFADSISRAHEERSMALVGLPGGRSLSGFYNGLGKLIPLEQRQHLFFFPVDERIAGNAGKESNGRALEEELCNAGLANPKQILRPDISKEKKGVVSWAHELGSFGSFLSELAPDGADLLIFGVGEDGHIASLFPKRAELDEKGDEWLEVHDAPKPPPHRVSISPVQIKRAKERWLVFRGREKQKALKQFLDKKVNYKICPAKLALAGQHQVHVWTDINV